MKGRIRSLLAIARALQKANSGLAEIWLVALAWNAPVISISAGAIADFLHPESWVGYLTLIFPLIGLLLLWAAISATWNYLRDQAERDGVPSPGAGSRAAPSRPASFYDSQDEGHPFGTHETSPAHAPDVAIPPSVATIEERAGHLIIHFAGGIMTALVGRLTVDVGDGHLKIRRAGLLGRKELRVPQSAVTEITPVLSYTVTTNRREKRYFRVTATTREGARIPVGRGLPGEETANWFAARIARALKLAPEHVRTV